MSLTNTHFIRAFDERTWTATRGGQPIGADELTCNPNSVNVSLGAKILLIEPRGEYIDLHDPDSFESFESFCAGSGLVLFPGNLYLASVREAFDCSAPLWIPQRIRTPDIKTINGTQCYYYEDFEAQTCFVQHIEGRSTVARVGLSTHASAGFGDYGFCAPSTLELTVALPLRVHEGDEIAQVAFVPLAGEPGAGYRGAYAGQTGPRVAHLGKGRFQRGEG